MRIASVEPHRPHLEAIIAAHADEPVDLFIVESIPAWCKERGGIDPPDPLGMAIRCAETKRAGILIRREMSEDAIQGTLDRLMLGNHGDFPEKVDSSELYLSHLVLHELAHLINSWGENVRIYVTAGPSRSFWECPPNYAFNRAARKGHRITDTLFARWRLTRHRQYYA